MPSDRLMESLGRRRIKRCQRKALKRLRAILEEGRERGRRAHDRRRRGAEACLPVQAVAFAPAVTSLRLDRPARPRPARLRGLAACGNEAHDPSTERERQVAETEGIYLELGELKYQVQVSRQLNPLLEQTSAYFESVEEPTSTSADDEVWFGVFMRVENESEEPHRRGRASIEIVDTQENEYFAARDRRAEPFAYRAGEVEGRELYPLPDTAAARARANGALLLFKLKRARRSTTARSSWRSKTRTAVRAASSTSTF